MKKIVWILAVALVVVAGLTLSFNSIVKKTVIVAVEQVTGAHAKIGGFSISLIKQRVSIRDFVLFNPPGFSETAMLEIPEVSVEWDVQALLKKHVHLPMLTLNLKEMVLVKDKSGNLNVDELKFARKNTPDEKKTEGKQEMMPFQIDQLNLTVGKVVFKDYTGGIAEPKVKVYDVGITNKQFRNITSPEQLTGLLIVEAMSPTAIRSAAMNAVSSVLNLKSLTIDTATGIFNRLKEKLK